MALGFIRVISSACHIRVHKHWLELQNKGSGECMRIHPDDLSILVVEHRETTYTQQALQLLAENGIQLVVCGYDHHPIALLQPIQANNLSTERLYLQVQTKLPKLKQGWKQVVQQKIRNQSACLAKIGVPSKRLNELARRVKTGDSSNCEGQAARFYWSNLFGKNFRRLRDGEAPNFLLNYGYMVLRAAMSKAIVGGGLHPALAMHHQNRSNAFCLSDDLMEPFRPFIDFRIWEYWTKEKPETLDKMSKAHLLEVLHQDVHQQGERRPLILALEETVHSYYNYLSAQRTKLSLPSF